MDNSGELPRARWILRLLVFAGAIYVFLAAIELSGHAFKMLGKGACDSLFSGLQNPFAGLGVGIVATAMLQSSSATTSTVVAMVGAGSLSLTCAIPIIMGANIGTSVTCTLVSLGHITQNETFRRAFAGATVHGFINLLTVVVLLPLELATHFMERGARWAVAALPLARSGDSFKSPVKTAVKWLAERIELFLRDTCGVGRLEETWGTDGTLLPIILSVLALVMIIASLVVITKNMQAMMADHIEEWLNRVLRRSGLLGLAVGALVTMVVQSSSITTSLLVPMFAAGVLALESGFPVMLGANIGTTITAMLAASVAGPLGLTIALVHVQFNVLGSLLFFPVKQMRQIPIYLASRLGALAERNRLWVLAYMLVVFFLTPVLGILIWRQ